MPNQAITRKLLAEDPEAFITQSLLEQLAILHVIDNAELLSGQPEVIHEFRVAVRTLRSQLKFFSPYFKNGLQVLAWSNELKWLDGHFQIVRDIDVQLGLLDAVSQDRLKNLVSKPAKYETYRKQVIALRGEIESTAAPAKQKLERALHSERRSKLFAEFNKGLLLAEFKPRRTAKMSRQLNELHSNQVHAISKQLGRTNVAKLSFKKLHAIRLDCKRARYLAETMAESAGDLAKAQSLLGEINDLSILSKWLEPRAMQRRRDRKVIILLMLEVNQMIANRRSQLPTLKITSH